MPQRKLLAIGTARYQDDEFEDLVRVPAAVDTMVKTFSSLGFETQSLLNPSKSACEDAIEAWLQDGEWSDDDLAVIYLTGHGISDAGGHYLAMTDSVADRYAKAVETRFISRALGNDPSLCRLLVLLDTCFSESGGDSMAHLAQSMKQEWNQRSDRRYLIVSSARSRQEAQQLVFANAFSQALAKLRGSFGTQSPFIPLGSVVGMTNLILAQPPISVAHRATYATLVPVLGDDGFFENPTYAGKVVTKVPADTVLASELHSHWLPRARGGAENYAPSLFQGREHVMEEITTWSTDTSQPSLLVVAGAPGTGKSTVIAQFVIPQDVPHGSWVNRRVELARAVHAHGLTAQAIRQRVEDLLHPDTAETGTRPVVIIDALDEAVDDFNLEKVVLEPLITAGIRVIVGVRPALLNSFVMERAVIDLDQRWWPSEVSQYVAKVLTSVTQSPYQPHQANTYNVADTIAALAGPNFLLARQIARTLARMDRTLTVAEINNSVRSYGSLANVFEDDLRRIGDDTGLIRELLTALAWSQGAGLAWEGIWNAVSNALFSPRTYTDADVRQTLKSASDYIVETLVDGRSYYRLYHELFAEHLRRGTTSSDAHARITQALISMTPTNERGERTWGNAHPYIQTHLAHHAAQGNVLEQMLKDPRATVFLNPECLRAALNSTTHRPLGTHESAVLRFLDTGPIHNEHHMSQLALAALQSGAIDLAARARELTPHPAWWPQWAHGDSLPPHTEICHLQGAVKAVHPVQWRGESLVVAASSKGELTCNEITTGRQLWDRSFDEVSAIAAVKDVTAVGTGSGPVHILRAADGSAVATLPGPTSGVNPRTTALAIHVQGTETLVATGSYDEDIGEDDEVWGGRLRLWRLAAPGNPLWTVDAFGGGVRTLQFRSDSGRLQVVAGGDPHNEPDASESVVRIFDALSGEMQYQAPAGLAVLANTVTSPNGSVLIIPSEAGTVLRWEPTTGAVLKATNKHYKTGISSLTPDGAVWLVATAKGVFALSSTTLKPSSEGSVLNVYPTALATTVVGQQTFVLSGSGHGDVLRWNLADLTAPNRQQRPLRITAITTVGDEQITYSLDDDTGALETARISDGRVIARTEQIYATALHSMDSSGGVYVGRNNGEVNVLNASTLEPIRPVMRLHTGTVRGLSHAESLLITCSDDAAVQVSDPLRGPVCPPLVNEDWKRRALYQVRVLPLNDGSRIVALAHERLVVWPLTETLKGAVNSYKNDGRNAARERYINLPFPRGLGVDTFCIWESQKGTVFFLPGNEGIVHIWSKPNGWTKWPTHHDSVSLIEMLNEVVLLTAGRDGLLCVWQLPERRLMAEVALGTSINALCPIDPHTVLVGTDSGLALLKIRHDSFGSPGENFRLN